jgi:hypothetical protein
LTILSIKHETVYHFDNPVILNHRLMLRPRESRDLRVLSNVLRLTPLAGMTWAQDVFGNSVVMANFTAKLLSGRTNLDTLAHFSDRGLSHFISFPIH